MEKTGVYRPTPTLLPPNPCPPSSPSALLPPCQENELLHQENELLHQVFSYQPRMEKKEVFQTAVRGGEGCSMVGSGRK
ncbi:unnamed protein product, partial [Closterium sp. NIES-64]